MGQGLERGRPNARIVVLEDRDEIGNEAIELRLVGKVATEGEKDVESSNDGCWACAVADVGAD